MDGLPTPTRYVLNCEDCGEVFGVNSPISCQDCKNWVKIIAFIKALKEDKMQVGSLKKEMK